MNRNARRIAIAAVGLLVAIQLWPVRRTNPPVTGEIEAPPEVKAVLRRACYDCHSNETRWTWYAYVAPVSWIVVGDVDKGRREMNLSQWAALTPRRKSMVPQKMLDKIETGAMPLGRYVRLHPEAKLTPEDVETIRRWAEASN